MVIPRVRSRSQSSSPPGREATTPSASQSILDGQDPALTYARWPLLRRGALRLLLSTHTRAILVVFEMHFDSIADPNAVERVGDFPVECPEIVRGLVVELPLEFDRLQFDGLGALVGACMSPIAGAAGAAGEVCGAGARWGGGLAWATAAGAAECMCRCAKVGWADIVRMAAKRSAFSMGMLLVLAVRSVKPLSIDYLGCFIV